jgi:hypothetical protein
MPALMEIEELKPSYEDVFSLSGQYDGPAKGPQIIEADQISMIVA